MFFFARHYQWNKQQHLFSVSTVQNHGPANSRKQLKLSNFNLLKPTGHVMHHQFNI
jgi:hypothetical protein